MKEIPLNLKYKRSLIRGVFHEPSKKSDSIIILVHGFTGNMNGPSDLYKRLANRLIENNFAVYRYNARFTTDEFEEFHKSTLTSQVSDLKHVVKEFSKKFKKVGVVGESLGGAISILGYSNKVKCLVLFYPAIFFKENIANRFHSDEQIREMNKNGLIPWIKRSSGQKVYIGKKFVSEVNRIEVLPKFSKIKCSILFIHGDADTVVNVSESKRAFKVANKPKELEIVKNAEHGFKDSKYNASEKLQDRANNITVNWFKEWLK